MISRILSSFLVVFMGLSAQAQIFAGDSGETRSFSEVVGNLKAGDVVILGERHEFALHQQAQMQVIESLKELGHRVSVGMEFLPWTQQAAVNQWRAGLLNEAAFLQSVEWGQTNFDFYRPQMSAPQLGLEYVWALNAPRALTSKISRVGLEALTDSEKALLPPGFEPGNAKYFERFKQAIGHLPNPDAAWRYFLAQSVWDDTMAWRIADFQKAHPEQILVVIVGEFHVQYGGGLPDRLQKRGVQNLRTVSLVSAEGLTEDEIQKEVSPGSDGSRADYIWVTRP